MTNKKDVTIDLWNFFLEKAKAKKRKIGIGINRVTPRVVESINKVKNIADIVVVGKKIDGFECVESNSIEPLMEMVKKKELDGFVRGNFDALEAYNGFRKVFNFKGSIREIGLFKLNGVKMINEKISGVFALLPASPSNERTTIDKIRSIDLHIKFFQDFGITPKIGVLSAGKPIDIEEAIPEIDKTLMEAEFLVNWYKVRGIWAKHFNHQLEYAAQEANIVVAQNAIAGNLCARTLSYFGTADFIGCLALNVGDIVYVDDSEAMEDFSQCLIFANAIVNLKNI